jgi:hypothetical protein
MREPAACPLSGSSIGHNYEQVKVTVRAGIVPCFRTEEIDLLRAIGLNQALDNALQRTHLVGHQVRRFAGEVQGPMLWVNAHQLLPDHLWTRVATACQPSDETSTYFTMAGVHQRRGEGAGDRARGLSERSGPGDAAPAAGQRRGRRSVTDRRGRGRYGGDDAVDRAGGGAVRGSAPDTGRQRRNALFVRRDRKEVLLRVDPAVR